VLALTKNGKQTLIPNSWEEAGEVAWQLLRDLSRLPLSEGKLSALRRLSGLGKRDFRKLTPADLAALDVGTPWLSIGSPLTEPLRKVMRHKGKAYHWPDLQFIDGQALAFQYADEYFEDALGNDAATSIEATRNLVATLARPMQGLRRKPVTTREEIEYSGAKLISLAPEWSAQALMYWTGVKLSIADTYGEYLFPSDTGGSMSTAPSFGWATVFRDVAAEGVFGDLAAVQAADFHDICQHLSTRVGRNNDERRAHEQAMSRQK
jgi:hypothetical protein